MGVIVIGVGNPDRGDDAAGREVARRLRAVALRGVEIVELDGEATALLARLDGAGAAILIDACSSGAPPGTLHRFDVAEAPLSSGAFGLSSHGFGLAEAIELGRELGTLPRRCVVYAIEGERFDIGRFISEKVMAGIDRAVEEIRAELKSL